MAGNADTKIDQTTAFDPLIQTENIAFRNDELIACGSCGRMNPPNRLKCLYCAGGLEVERATDTAIRPVLRKLDGWERGFNLIVLEKANTDDVAVGRVLSMDMAELDTILETGIPLPVARVESENYAAILQQDTEKLGLRTTIVSDDALAADKPHSRLSQIIVTETGFVFRDFNKGHETEIAFGDLVLIVPGMITASRLESLEKKGRKGRTQLVDETATASDEMVLDLYSNSDATGFRINLTGFDFSCLGDEKGMLAVENMRRLIVFLKERSPNAKLVSNYSAVRQALGTIWEVETRRDSQGLRRSGLGKVEFGSVSSTSNLNQFTKFSRLQWHLQ